MLKELKILKSHGTSILKICVHNLYRSCLEDGRLFQMTFQVKKLMKLPHYAL